MGFQVYFSMKAKRQKKDSNINELDALEILNAETHWTLNAQEALKEDGNCKQPVLHLGIYEAKGGCEENGVLKCKERLGISGLEMDHRFPVILPKNLRLMEFILLACHKEVCQNAFKSILAELCSCYCIPQ